MKENLLIGYNFPSVNTTIKCNEFAMFKFILIEHCASIDRMPIVSIIMC